jgi:CNT family concentrative nucleoside transporter
MNREPAPPPPPEPSEAVRAGQPGAPAEPPPNEVPPELLTSATPWAWRGAIALGVVVLTTVAFLGQDVLGSRGQAALGVVCFFAIAAFFSADLRRISWRTVGWGVALQIALVLFIRVPVYGLGGLGIPDGTRPGYELFEAITGVVKQVVEFAMVGAKFVFGPLASPQYFAFSVLPVIIFFASLFSVLYYFGVLQFVVRQLAWVMMRLLRTSGAETLSVTANVFLGQTEAPLTIKPFLPKMTRSELLTVMVGGMAHISGGLMAVYIGMGADAVAILATSVMAAPCSLYLSKVVLPETGKPETFGHVEVSHEKLHRNVIDAAAAGASDGMMLAINVAAMLIAFLAFLAMADYLLGRLASGQPLLTTLQEGGAGGATLSLTMLVLVFVLLVMAGKRFWPALFARDNRPLWLLKGGVLLVAFAVYVVVVDVALRNAPPHLDLKTLFSWLFAPAAVLMGVQGDDIGRVANLLGIKLAANEFVAYAEFAQIKDTMSPRSRVLATYALTGFANFASIGIQLGGIGGMAPTRRGDLARLGGLALLVGFLVTLLNASLAALLSD